MRLRMRVLLVEGDRVDLGREVLAIFVEVPEFAPRDIGVVRMGKGDGEAPGAPARIVVFPRSW